MLRCSFCGSKSVRKVSPYPSSAVRVWCSECENYAWAKEEEEKMPPKYKHFVFAHPEDKGKHYNSIPTVLHDTPIAAEREAERLSKQEPNVRFCVGVIYKHYENIPVSKVNEVVYAFTNLR